MCIRSFENPLVAKLSLLILTICIPFGAAFGYGYEIWYGNIDGTPVATGINQVVNLPVYLSTDGDNLADSLSCVHNPLASNNLIITARLGGSFVLPFDDWGDISFLPPDADTGGYTNQSVLGFIHSCIHNVPPVNTNGMPILFGYYSMRIANDSSLIGTVQYPFREGNQTINHGHFWGNQSGTVTWIPIQHYGGLIFSHPPQWGPNPGPINRGAQVTDSGSVEICFDLTGTDPATEELLTITGPYGFSASGVGGSLTAHFCHNYTVSGFYVEHFDLTDSYTSVGIDVEVNVDVDIVEGALDIRGHQDPSDPVGCIHAFPGADIEVPVTLHTQDHYTGGFDITIQWDPTVLNYTGLEWGTRINDGSEYNNVLLDIISPGSAHLVWIADINDGVYTSPAIPDLFWDFPLFSLNFHVGNAPYGMMTEVAFYYPDSGDPRYNTFNTISDSTGYLLEQPPHYDGCITIDNPESFRGDPNMNCEAYEIADAVLVAGRLIEGVSVWDFDNTDFPPPDPSPACNGEDRHDSDYDGAQEAAADLNDNGFPDVGDLVWFINIINGNVMPPKLDPVTGWFDILLNDGTATINSNVEIAAVLIRVQGDITPVSSDLETLVGKADNITSILIYSLNGATIPPGDITLFTYSGDGAVLDISASDSYGRLLESTSRIEPAQPIKTSLGRNFPNPFNPATAFRLALAEAGEVELAVYDITGRKVRTLISSRVEAGYHEIIWDGQDGGGSDAASGVYFARMAAFGKSETIKLLLIR